MTIQFNTDNNIEGKERLAAFVNQTIAKELDRFDEYITRIEVYLSDENGDKKGPKDKKCVIEARLRNKQPLAVSTHEETIEKAVSVAISKVKSALNSSVGKLQDR